MKLVRWMAVQTLKYNIMFEAVHPFSYENHLADLISHLQVTEFLHSFLYKDPERKPLQRVTFFDLKETY